MKAAFIGLLFSGLFALIAGMLLTRLHWRPDIPPYGRHTRVLDVTFHPERYAKDAPSGLIRLLSVIGTLFLISAAALVIFEIVRTMLSGGTTRSATVTTSRYCTIAALACPVLDTMRGIAVNTRGRPIAKRRRAQTPSAANA